MSDLVRSIPYWIGYHAWTAFLFTKTEFTTTLIPLSSLAAASTPIASWNRLLPMVFWLWIQLLMFDLANQTLDREEDQVNKKWRPLPSGRLSRRTAVILRWLMPFINLAWSAQYSKEVVLACLGTCVTTYLYNEGGFGDGHWAGRNICNVMVAAGLEFGTCLIAGKSAHSLDKIALHSILSSIALLCTTIQAQDFRDVDGDRLIGRKTLPLVHPTLARPTLVLAIVIWSVTFSFLWGLGIRMALAFIILGAAVGWRYLAKTSPEEDSWNYFFYNVWLSVALALPAYFRFIISSSDDHAD